MFCSRWALTNQSVKVFLSYLISNFDNENMGCLRKGQAVDLRVVWCLWRFNDIVPRSHWAVFEIIHLWVVFCPPINRVTLRLLTVEVSPFPQLIGCIAVANNSSCLASIYVMLMFYDGGGPSRVLTETHIDPQDQRFTIAHDCAGGICA